MTCRVQVIVLRSPHPASMYDCIGLTGESRVATSSSSQPAESQSDGRGSIRLIVAIALTVWLLLVVSHWRRRSTFVSPRVASAAIAIGVAGPWCSLFRMDADSPFLPRFVLSLDLRLIAGMQAWRWAGLGFLSCMRTRCSRQYSPFRLRPQGQRWPSGSRPRGWCLRPGRRQPGFAARGTFIRWNVLRDIGPRRRGYHWSPEYPLRDRRPGESVPLRWQHRTAAV